MVFEIENLDDLKRQASLILGELGKPGVVLFKGEMGAGKTTLIRLLCELLQSPSVVSSPTFSLVNEYELPEGHTLFHFDFYRIQSEEEAMDMGVEEYLYSGNWCFIEWPERIGSLIPEDFKEVRLEVSADKRMVYVD
jgi:tRNA threonylcarbamoyladenosine biosynthesis protein TsaE